MILALILNGAAVADTDTIPVQEHNYTGMVSYQDTNQVRADTARPPAWVGCLGVGMVGVAFAWWELSGGGDWLNDVLGGDKERR